MVSTTDELGLRGEADVRAVVGGRQHDKYWALCVDEPRGQWFCLPVTNLRNLLLVGLPFFTDSLVGLGGRVVKLGPRQESEVRALLIEHYAAERGSYVGTD
jgi:hypothetical protein